MKVLKEMRWLIVAAIAIVAALVAMYFYQMRVITHLSENAYAVTDDGVLRTLKNQAGEEGQELKLTEVSEQEPVYLRLGSMYVGTEKVAADAAMPFFVNNGASALFMLGDAELYNTDFETVSSFTGMYLADGITYNYDKTQADDDTFYFAKLSNGLFLNAKSMTITIPGKNYVLPMNSIVYMDENAITYYRNDNGVFTYGEVMSTAMAEVTVGDLTIGYEELLGKLGVLNTKGSSDLTINGNATDSTEVQPEEGNAVEVMQPEGNGGNGDEEYPLTPDESQQELEKSSEELEKAAQEAKDAAEQARQEEEAKTEDNASGNSDNSGGSSTSNTTPANSNSGNSGSSNNANSGDKTDSSNKPSNGADGSTINGEEVKVPFVVPSATLSNLTTDIYSLSGNLAINDPSGALRRITLELYWVPENEDGTPAGNVSDQSRYQLMYRRTYRAAGDFTIDNLPPGTTIYVKGTLSYYTEGLETKTITFYDSFENRISTLSMSTMDPVYVDFVDAQGDELYRQNQIRIYDLRLSGPNKNVLKKVNKAVISVKATDLTSGKVSLESNSLSIGTSVLNRDYIYKEDGKTYLSDIKQLSLPANARIDYEIKLYDTFGNQLTNMLQGYEENQVADSNISLKAIGGSGSYRATGTTYTCKTMPAIEVTTMSAGTTEKQINQLNFQLTLSDPHNAIDTQSNLLLQLYKGTDTESGTLVETREISVQELIASSGATTTVNFADLTAGSEYYLVIYGDYDLNDKHGVYQDALLATANASTIPLSSYGRVNYTLTASHVKLTDAATGVEEKYESATAQKVTIQVNEATTKQGLFLYDYVDRIDFQLTETGTATEIFNGTIEKERLKKIEIAGEGSGEKKTIVYQLKELFGEDVIWDYTDNQPTVEFTYRDFAEEETENLWDLFTWGHDGMFTFNFGEDTLQSFTAYQIYLTTYAKQGADGALHDVSGRTNLTRRVQFTTLRRMPELKYNDFMIYSDQVHMYEIYFNDPDKSIYGGAISVNNGQISKSYTVNYDEEKGGYVAEIDLSDLRIGSEYTMTITADQIRRSSSTSYRYSNVELFGTTFTAGDGITGKLTLQRLSYALVNKNDSGKSYLKEDFDIYDGGYENYYLNNNAEPTANGSWYMTDYLPVEAGKIYYFDRVRSNDAYEGRVCFYDADKQLIRNSFGYIYNGSYIEVPEGASYLRYSVADTYQEELCIYVGGCYQMQMSGAEIVTKMQDYTDKTKKVTYTVGTDKESDIKFTKGQGDVLVYIPKVITESNANYSTNPTITFYDKNDKQLSTASPRRGVGVAIPDEAAKVIVTSSFVGSLYVADGEMKAWLDDQNMDKMESVTKVTVKDTRRNLIKNPTYKITLYEDGKEITDYEITGDERLIYESETSGGIANALISLECKSGGSYKVTLTTEYRGHTLLLDTEEYKADLPKYVISSEKDVYKLVRYKSADFIVTDDLTFPVNTYIERGYKYPFNGNIDFQDHTVNVSFTGNNTRLFRTLGSSAVLENLQLNVTMDASQVRRTLTDINAIAYDSYGTIRNVIVNLNLGSGYYQKNACSGLVRHNYGTIENFALYYDAGSYNYVGNNFGGLVVHNYGTIRNGMVYSSRWLQAITGQYRGDINSASTANVGGVAATIQTGGTIENVYAVMSVGVERDNRTTTDKNGTQSINLTSNGILFGGYGGGRIVNCFTVGDLYELYWKQSEVSGAWGREYNVHEKYTPVGAGNTNRGTNQNRFKNSYYFAPVGKYAVDESGYIENGQTTLRLSDLNFYGATVNAAGEFHTNDIAQGFYPRVEMDETLLNQQQRILYTAESATAGVTYVGATVTAQTDEYADVTLTFSNPLGYTIADLKASYLLVNGQSAETPDAEAVAYEQYQEGSFYYVKVRVWPNGQYRDSYKINSFGIRLGSFQSEVSNVNRSVGVSFYKPVNMENWLEAFDDINGNYRLVGDIDMQGFRDSETAANQVLAKCTSSKPFTGKIRGEGHIIRNVTIQGTTASMIPYADGADIENLTFENVKIGTASSTLGSYAGIIGAARKQTVLSDIYVKNITITNPYQYAGGIVGYLDNSSIINCGVQKISSTVTGRTSDLRMGAVVGYNYYSSIENSYASGIDMDISSTQANVIGIGGIAGQTSYNANIRSCYAQGKIFTTSGDAGGVTGQADGIINRCWTKVDISGSATAGGIVGRAQSNTKVTQLLAVGNVSGQANSTGRMVGVLVNAGTTLSNAYAFDGQKLQGNVSEEILDANGLMSAEEMKVAAYYWNNINLGYDFRYTDSEGGMGIENGYLPLLYNDEQTELLKYQTPVLFQLDSSEVSLAVRDNPTATINSMTNSYDLDFTLELKTPGLTKTQLETAPDTFYQTLQTALEHLDISGMEFNFGLDKVAQGEWSLSDLWSENTGRFSWSADGNVMIIHCTQSCVSIKIYRDSYQVVYEYTDATGSVWEVSSPLDFGTALYMPITSVYNPDKSEEENRADLTSWYGAMKAEGKNYQNFMIMNDLDFSTLPVQNAADLINLNINRLVGREYTAPEFAGEQEIKDYLLYGRRPEKEDGQTVEVPSGPEITISNLNVTATANSQSWIRVLQGTMEGIRFENCSWSNVGQGASYAGTNIGLIGKNTGTIHYVDFEDVMIRAGKASGYVGCIGYNQGTVEYVRVKDVDVSNDPSTVTHRVGGMIGSSENPVTHCGIVGTDAESYKVTVTYTTNSVSDYTGGMIGYMNNYVRYCYADQVNVSGRQRTGGLAGYSYVVYGQDDSYVTEDIKRNPIFYYVQVTNSTVTGKFYTGGVYGASSDARRAVSIRNKVTQPESGAYLVGGVTGSDGWTVQWLYAADCTITTAGKSAGGIIGHSSPVYDSISSGNTIRANSMAGGIEGSLSNYYIRRCKVEDCDISADTYAGGIVGFSTATGANTSYDDMVLGNTLVHGTGSSSSYIGGYAGADYSNGLRDVQIDDSVKVTGYNYVGGVYGIVSGGEHYAIEIGATIEGAGNYTGGFAGEVIGYTQSITSPANPTTQTLIILANQKTEVRDVIISGKIKGKYYVGGFTGLFDKGDQPIDPDNGEAIDDKISGYVPYMSQDYYRRIVIAPLSIEGSGSVKAAYNNTNTVIEKENAGIGYLRIYEGIEGSVVAGEIDKLTDLKKALTDAGGKFANVDQAAKTYGVTDENLSDPTFYQGSTLEGKMYLMNQGNNSNRHFDASQMNTENGVATTFPMMRGNDTNYLIHIERTAKVNGEDKKLAYNQWVYGSTNGGVESILSGHCQQDGILLPANVKAAEGVDTTAVTYAMTDADIAAVADTLSVYASGIDTINVDIPGELFGNGLSLQVEDADGVVTTAGALDELAGRVETQSGTDVDNTADAESSVDKTPGTITLHYDFNTYLTLTLLNRDGDAVEVYAIDPANISRTLSSGSEDLYYIRQDGVVSVNAMAADSKIESAGVDDSDRVEDTENSSAVESTTTEVVESTEQTVNDGAVSTDDSVEEDTSTTENEENVKEEFATTEDTSTADASVLAAEGSFVHLYGDKALTDAGEIVNLITGAVTGTVDRSTVGTACVTAKAAYTTYTKSGSVLDMYAQYSLATTDGITAARDFRLFTKLGQMFAVDVATAREDGAGIHDLVADVYRNGQNEYQYLSYLKADGTVKDLGDKIHWPKELSNSSMGEIAGNITGTQPVLLVRYQDNTVAAFQYMTGTLLMKDTSAKKELDFLQYATIWFANLKAGFTSADNTAYLAAVKLTGDLKAEPVDTDLALNVTGDGENVSDEIHEADTAARVTAGSNLMQGVYNAAAANWKAEALNAHGEKGQAFLSLAEENLENALLAFAKNGTSDANGMSDVKGTADGNTVAEEEAANVSTEKNMEITEENAADVKDAVELALADDAVAQELQDTLVTEGYSEEEAQQMYRQYVSEVKKSVDEAAAYSVSGAAEQGAAKSDTSESDVTDNSDNESTGHITTISNDSYVIAMNSDTGAYEVYNEKDLLDTKTESAALMSENQKLVRLKDAGLLKSGVDLDELKVTAEENRQGLILIAVAAAGIAVLLIVMYRKRKKMQ